MALQIAQAFPASELQKETDGVHTVYKILLGERVLIRLDSHEANFNYPTRGSSKMVWSSIKEGWPETVARQIVRDLADAGFTVLTPEGKRVQKRPVFIGRITYCLSCYERGLIRKIVYGSINKDFDAEIFVDGGRGKGFNDFEIKCIGCGWEGFPEDVRFTKKRVGT